jgi:hypothetical protein
MLASLARLDVHSQRASAGGSRRRPRQGDPLLERRRGTARFEGAAGNMPAHGSEGSRGAGQGTSRRAALGRPAGTIPPAPVPKRHSPVRPRRDLGRRPGLAGSGEDEVSGSGEPGAAGAASDGTGPEQPPVCHVIQHEGGGGSAGYAARAEATPVALHGRRSSRARMCWRSWTPTRSKRACAAQQARRRDRAHQDSGQEPAGARAEGVGRHHYNKLRLYPGYGHFSILGAAPEMLSPLAG